MGTRAEAAKKYGILYPIIGSIVSVLAIIFMGLGVFMWLFLIGGSILFFGGIYCAHGIIGEYRKIRKGSEIQKNPSEIEFPSDSKFKTGDGNRLSSLIWKNVQAVERVRRVVL